MLKIILGNKKECLVDNEDYPRLIKYRWQWTRGHATCNKIPAIYMHRFILNPPKGLDIDHINGDKLDNRKANLRLCTRAENGRNRGKNKNNKSGYKGVYWKKSNNNWVAQIGVDRKVIHLGSFSDKKEAASAYDNAAKQYHGEFARSIKQSC